MKTKKLFLTVLLGLMTTFTLSAQGGITEVGATSPNSVATTTYDNPSGPNHAPGGPHRAAMEETGGLHDHGETTQPGESQPIGTPWVLLGFAAAYAGVRLVKRGRRGV